MKRFTRLMALLLAAVLILTSCGQAANNDGASSQTNGSETEKTSSSESSGHDGSSKEESEPSSGESSLPPESSEESPEASSSEETAEAQEVPGDAMAAFFGGAATPTEIEEATEADDDEIQRIDRVMRDYSPVTTLFVNNAKSYYYYDQLDDQLQNIYDCLLMACYDPSGENYVAYVTNESPRTEEFRDKATLAMWAMMYDHPELFFLYTGRHLHWLYGRSTSAPYTVYFYVDKYEEYETEVPQFNKAAQDFLKDIKTKDKTDAEIALQIHDKLVDLVDYDYTLYYDKRLAYDDLGHTAFGALVHNEDGTPNTAVCDGYTLAYIYLMQQVGLQAIYLGGWCGSTLSDMGGHAWNMAYLDGKWYEIDVTWDDYSSCLIDPENATSQWRPYWQEIYNTDWARDVVEHEMFMITSAQMNDFVGADTIYYTTSDGKWVFHLNGGSSVHRRDCQVPRWYICDQLSELAPTAK